MADKNIIDISEIGGVPEKAFKFFCRHLVALAMSYQVVDIKNQPQDEPKALLYSGCILSIRNTWAFLTAGYILKDIERYVSNKRIKIGNWHILDNFGHKTISDKSVPFDFINSTKFYIDEDGLDFGIIILRDHYKKLLEANGVVPISKENWFYQTNIEFDRFIMLGLPTKFVNSEITGTQNLVVSHAPTMIWIEKIIGEGISKTKFNRFIGKIDKKCILDDIDGMSGGPIFGFAKGHNDRYWIVAIQSSWLKDQKIIFACRVPVLARLIENAI